MEITRLFPMFFLLCICVFSIKTEEISGLSISGGFGRIKQKNAPVQIVLRKTEIDMTANAFSGDLSAGYNFRLSDKISLRTKLSAILGYSSFVKIANIKTLLNLEDSPIDIGDYCNNMNTLNLSIGITFHNTKPFD